MVLLYFTIIYAREFYVTEGIKSVSSHYREIPKFVMNSWYEVGNTRKFLSIPIPSSFGVGIGHIEY